VTWKSTNPAAATIVNSNEVTIAPGVTAPADTTIWYYSTGTGTTANTVTINSDTITVYPKAKPLVPVYPETEDSSTPGTYTYTGAKDDTLSPSNGFAIGAAGGSRSFVYALEEATLPSTVLGDIIKNTVPPVPAPDTAGILTLAGGSGSVRVTLTIRDTTVPDYITHKGECVVVIDTSAAQKTPIAVVDYDETDLPEDEGLLLIVTPTSLPKDTTGKWTLLSWKADDTLKVTVPDAPPNTDTTTTMYSAYTWYVDGAFVSGPSNSNSMSLNAQDPSLGRGMHSVAVQFKRVVTEAGVAIETWHSSSERFEVTQ
jgi:hypothetical protein